MERMHAGAQSKGPYLKLLAMSALSFLAMYGLMYAMVDTLGNVFNNVNQLYMAGVMTMPMVIFELLLMGRMYPERKTNAVILVACAAGLVVFWTCIRQQTGIADSQFLRSMITHHGGAILMCTQSPSKDPEIRQLCRDIVSSQRSEIAFMKSKLEAVD